MCVVCAGGSWVGGNNRILVDLEFAYMVAERVSSVRQTVLPFRYDVVLVILWVVVHSRYDVWRDILRVCFV